MPETYTVHLGLSKFLTEGVPNTGPRETPGPYDRNSERTFTQSTSEKTRGVV